MTSPLSRRNLLKSAGCLAAASMLPGISVSFAAAPVEQRFIFVILRGAMDGLAAIPPYGDRDYRAARGGLALDKSLYLPLDARFGAHRNLATLAAMFAEGEAAVIHAVSTPYRERSHFDAQNVLETGGTGPHRQHDGWLNRALAMYGRGDNLGLAVGQTIPLALQGTVPVGTWAPSADGMPDDTLLVSLERIYRKDALFHTALAQAVDVHAIADGAASDMIGGKMSGKRLQNREAMGQTVSAVGRILAERGGPRIATIEVGGWDTHAQQGTERGPLANLFLSLDAGLKTLKSSLGANWNKTVVLVATEFGRTVQQNGTGGTDHGTASCALLLGGAVNGGRVYGEWPGLAKSQQYEGRDLRPTTDLRQVAKAVLQDHMGLQDADIDRFVFPGSSNARALQGIIRT